MLQTATITSTEAPEQSHREGSIATQWGRCSYNRWTGKTGKNYQFYLKHTGKLTTKFTCLGLCMSTWASRGKYRSKYMWRWEIQYYMCTGNCYKRLWNNHGQAHRYTAISNSELNGLDTVLRRDTKTKQTPPLHFYLDNIYTFINFIIFLIQFLHYNSFSHASSFHLSPSHFPDVFLNHCWRKTKLWNRNENKHKWERGQEGKAVIGLYRFGFLALMQDQMLLERISLTIPRIKQLEELTELRAVSTALPWLPNDLAHTFLPQFLWL